MLPDFLNPDYHKLVARTVMGGVKSCGLILVKNASSSNFRA